MSLLLDTHVALWWVYEPDRLNPSCYRALERSPVVYFSVVTPWEFAIKEAVGKLSVPGDIAHELSQLGFSVLPISVDHARRVGRLPLHHRDPFDRMLIAQAQAERLTLVSANTHLAQYDVDVMEAAR